MANNLSLYNLTKQQILFLEALAGEAEGDYKTARELAGYSPTTSMSDIIRPIKDHIAALTREVLVQNGIKAAFGVANVLNQPDQMGAANKLKAATEILDRIGVVKPVEAPEDTNKGAIFILPPKNVSAITVNGSKVVIDMDDNPDDDGTIIEGEYEDDLQDALDSPTEPA